jgi:DNA-binding winged helix-turn-helix (wHTH) protein
MNALGFGCQLGHVFAIGEDVLFDESTHRLMDARQPDRPIQLDPVTAGLLAQFVHVPQTVVRRHQLFQNWRQCGMEACESSLNQAIHALREAFCAVDSTRLYIQHIPRIGYALIADTYAIPDTRTGPIPRATTEMSLGGRPNVEHAERVRHAMS